MTAEHDERIPKRNTEFKKLNRVTKNRGFCSLRYDVKIEDVFNKEK